MPQLRVDYTGKCIGNRFVKKLSHFTKHNDPIWEVRCGCGSEFLSLTQDLKRPYCRYCKGDIKRKRPFETVYNAFVQKAIKRGKNVELTYNEFVELTNIKECHYCSSNIIWVEYQTKKGKPEQNRLAYHLDRKDSSVGYTKDNVVVCCTRCNLSKNEFFTYTEWLEIGKLIQSWRIKMPLVKSANKKAVGTNIKRERIYQ